MNRCYSHFTQLCSTLRHQSDLILGTLPTKVFFPRGHLWSILEVFCSIFKTAWMNTFKRGIMLTCLEAITSIQFWHFANLSVISRRPCQVIFYQFPQQFQYSLDHEYQIPYTAHIPSDHHQCPIMALYQLGCFFKRPFAVNFGIFVRNKS